MSHFPFEDSRRLTGPNPYFASTGAALETAPGTSPSSAMLAAWRANIVRMCQALDWPVGAVIARSHASGASLAFAAPADRLLCATEVNEWAWGAACGNDVGHAPAHAASWDFELARHTLAGLAAEEAIPSLLHWLDVAARHPLPALFGEDVLTLGSGVGGMDIPFTALAMAPEPDWARLFAVPTAVVTGSNGKTTTVRLLAAMQRAAGRRVGFNCTDGLFVEGQRLESGDYSGPIGARTVLRRRDIDAAVLETARGGLLRRGMAVQRADVAVVTNISADHFGEYGVHSIADLAQVKLTAARVLDARGLLVLNVDDAVLRDAAAALNAPIGWFSLGGQAHWLRQHAANRPVCVAHEDHLWLHPEGLAVEGVDLGDISIMPLTLGGKARYNIANLAAAALGAHHLGVAVETIRVVLAEFGRDNADNRGRLERWNLGGVHVWLDYAHNPDGLAGLLDGVAPARGDARLGLLLGHAGNRLDEDLRAVAATAARYHPARVVLKDIDGYARGRDSGGVADVMREVLHTHGVPDIDFIADETQAVRALLDWATPGDVLVLPIHGFEAREAVIALLDGLAGHGSDDVISPA